MGAYTNPETAIDTQSGQHVRNMVSSMAQIGVNAIQERSKYIKAQQDKDRESTAASNKFAEKLASDIYSIDTKDTDIDLAAYYGSVSPEIVRLQKEVSDGVNPDMPAVISRLAALKKRSLEIPGQLIGLGKSFGESIQSAKNKGVGMAGGLWSGYADMPEEEKNKYDNAIKIGEIMTGNGGYRNVKVRIEPIGTNFEDAMMYVTALDINGKEVKLEMSNSGLSNNAEAFPDSSEFTLLDETDNYKSIASANNIFKVEDNKGIKTVKGINIDNIIASNPNYVKQSWQTASKTTDQTGKLVKQKEISVWQPNIDEISKDKNLMTQAASKVEGLIQYDPKRLYMTCQDILYKQDTFDPPAGGFSLEWLNENKDKIVEAYSKDMVYNLLGQSSPQPFKNADGSAVTREKVNKEPREEEKKELTDEQKRKIRHYNLAVKKGLPFKEYIYNPKTKQFDWNSTIDATEHPSISLADAPSVFELPLE